MGHSALALVDGLALAYLLGTLVGLKLPVNFLAYGSDAWFFLLVLVFLVLFSRWRWRDRLGWQLLLLTFITVLAAFRASDYKVERLVGGEVALSGFVAEMPNYSASSQKFPFQTAEGSFWLKTERYDQSFAYGDRLEVSGRLVKRNERWQMDFPKINRLNGRGGYPILAKVYAFREGFKEKLRQILPEPEVSLALGILLGGQNLPQSRLVEDLRTTGTSHIVSVSGYNISIVITGLTMLLVGWGNIVLAILVFISILVFDLLVGFTSPVLRATFMGLFILTARILGRQQNLPEALLISAAFIALIDPLALTGTSFQLSFLSTLGILVFGPYLKRFLGHWPSFISGDLAVTLSAQLAVLPVVVYNFGTVSFISPLANLLVVWTVPPLMALTFLAGVLAFLFLPLGQLVGSLDLVLLTYFLRVIELLARIPGAVIHL